VVRAENRLFWHSAADHDVIYVYGHGAEFKRAAIKAGFVCHRMEVARG
jgi:hypothetical protein